MDETISESKFVLNQNLFRGRQQALPEEKPDKPGNLNKTYIQKYIQQSLDDNILCCQGKLKY